MVIDSGAESNELLNAALAKKNKVKPLSFLN